MKLSIIIPVYNVENYIRECVNSIFQQGLEEDEFEVILVNDGSTDNSQIICEELVKNNNNIRLINQENKGLSGARNTGILVSAGRFIYFIDSDDYLLRLSLKQILIYIEEYDLEFAGFESNRTFSRPDLSKDSACSDLNIITTGNGIEMIANHQYNNSACMYVFKKELLTKANLFFVEGRNCEDGMFTTSLLLNVKSGVFFSNPIYQYYNNPTSIVNTMEVAKNEKLIDDMLFVISYLNKEILKISIDHHKAILRVKNRQESYLYFCIIRMIKGGYSYDDIIRRIKNTHKSCMDAFHFNYFKGYDVKDKFLITIFKNPISFRSLIFFNKIIKVIR